MFLGNDEQLINALRHIGDSRLSNEVRGVAGAAADRIEVMRKLLEHVSERLEIMLAALDAKKD